MISVEQVKQWEADIEYWRNKWLWSEAKIKELGELLVTCRIRCERAEKRLALELRKRGELEP